MKPSAALFVDGFRAARLRIGGRLASQAQVGFVVYHGGIAVNDDIRLEREADRAGSLAARWNGPGEMVQGPALHHGAGQTPVQRVAWNAVQHHRIRIEGEGQDFERVRALGKPNVEFLGRQDDETIRELYAGCRAFILPGEEDFGITPLEAQACGRPVIALGAGGALETVVGVNADEYEVPQGFIPWGEAGDGEAEPTGMFFSRSEPTHIEEAVVAFEKMEKRFSPEASRKQAERFARENFKKAARERFRQSCLNHRERLENSMKNTEQHR